MISNCSYKFDSSALEKTEKYQSKTIRIKKLHYNLLKILTVLFEVVVFFVEAAVGVETLWSLASTTSVEAKWPCEELRDDVRLDIGELLILLREELERSNSPPRFLSRPLSLSKRRTIEATLRGCVFFTSAASEDVFLPIIGLFEAEGIFSIKSFGNL